MKKIIISLAVLTAIFILFTAFSKQAFAISDNARGAISQSQSNNSNGSNSSDNSNSSGKLTEAKQKICKQSENRIHNLFSNIKQLADKQISQLDQTTEKVKQYYANNQLYLENYDNLLQSTVETRLAAQTALQTSTQTSSQFGCDTTDPKGTINQYKAQVRSQIQELKNYRTAVKNFISAVKTATSAEPENQ